eukprot:2303797-Pyramimonas_sp.AAC.1
MYETKDSLQAAPNYNGSHLRRARVVLAGSHEEHLAGGRGHTDVHPPFVAVVHVVAALLAGQCRAPFCGRQRPLCAAAVQAAA